MPPVLQGEVVAARLPASSFTMAHEGREAVFPVQAFHASAWEKESPKLRTATPHPKALYDGS